MASKLESYGFIAVQIIKSAVKDGDVDFFNSEYFEDVVLPIAETNRIVHVGICKKEAAQNRKSKYQNKVEQLQLKIKETKKEITETKDSRRLKTLNKRLRHQVTRLEDLT